MKRNNIFAFILSFVLLFSLVSCSSSVSGDKSEYELNRDTTPEANSNDYAKIPIDEYYGSSDIGGKITESTTPSIENDLSERKIIKNANIYFQTVSYDEFIQSLKDCIAANNGYVQSSENRGGGINNSRSSRSSYFSVRVPADNYDSFMNTVSTLGSVTSKNESIDDITLAYVDMESHIKALETEYDALIQILEKAESLSDVIQLQSRISEVNYQLDSYKSQLKKYDDLISYCTISINVSEVVKEVKDEDSMTFIQKVTYGLGNTFESIGEEFSAFSVWLIVKLPYILIDAAVIALAIIVIRCIIKKSKRRREIKLVERLNKQNDVEKQYVNSKKDN